MHMIWINLIPQLVKLWTNDFHEIGAGSENYLIGPQLWAVLGNICKKSGDTIPSSFGCRVPHLKKRGNFIAESWSLWATQLAPHILRRRFSNPKYYIHFVRLIKLIKECTSLSLARAELPRIRKGLADWVKDFETIYYQKTPDRLQTCPVNLHYVLHIVDSIEYLGPPWVYWAYPMERYCSFVGTSVKSRRFPYANISRRLLDVAQLRVIRERYNLHDVILSRQTQTSSLLYLMTFAHIYIDPDRLLLAPSGTKLAVTKQLKNQIMKYLGTAFRMPNATAKTIIPATLKQWARMRITGGGDLIQARGYHKLRMDGRDASFVRYELLVDRLAHRRNAPEDLVRKSHYGQVQYIFKLRLPPKVPGNPGNKSRKLLLALILEAPTEVASTYEYEVVSYKGGLSKGEVVDASTIQCAVGRVFDRDSWWIIDRAADISFTEFV
ncbi:hypothetical protein BDV93DRAFT_437887 [Ceratobasidium sp. AG-I]|nr:hypothetical protein BDV93DRAFT_437887 [Ceratobasidium sp. AG-I]